MIRVESPHLMEHLRAGGQDALADVFISYRPQLQRMVERRIDPRLQRRVGASDILQQGFLDASRRLDEYLAEPRMPFYLWLRYLVRQQLMAATRWHFSAKKRDARREQNAATTTNDCTATSVVAEELATRLSSPSHVAARGELHQQLTTVLDKLAPLDREMIVLRHFGGLSNAETAEHLGLTVAAASKRYLRAIERLKTASDQVLAAWQT